TELDEVSRLCLRASLTRQHCPHSGTPNLAGMRRPLVDPTTCELCRLAWSLHYSQPGTQNESTDQKTHTDLDKMSDPKNTSIPHVSDSMAPAHPLFGCVGTGAGCLYHYCAAIDLGRSDPDCKRY